MPAGCGPFEAVCPLASLSCVVGQSVPRDAAAATRSRSMLRRGGDGGPAMRKIQCREDAPQFIRLVINPAARDAKMAMFGKRGQHVAEVTFPVATLLLTFSRTSRNVAHAKRRHV
eukprot:4584689-Prymnesium_polylepis.1